jgi:hypothetical protein
VSRTYKDNINRRWANLCWFCRHHRETTLVEKVLFRMTTGKFQSLVCDHPGLPSIRRSYFADCHYNIRQNTKYYYYVFHDRRDRDAKRRERQDNRTHMNRALRIGSEIPVMKHRWLD